MSEDGQYLLGELFDLFAMKFGQTTLTPRFRQQVATIVTNYEGGDVQGLLAQVLKQKEYELECDMAKAYGFADKGKAIEALKRAHKMLGTVAAAESPAAEAIKTRNTAAEAKKG